MTQKLKLSPATITILRNFSNINKSLMFRQGNRLTTISETKATIAEATIAESFKSNFAIYDLPRFLSVLSLFDDPELEIGDKFITIQQDKRKLNYTFAEPSMILSVTKETIGKIKAVVDAGEAKFSLPFNVFSDVNKALLTLKLPEYVVSGDGQEITLKAVDTANPTGDIYAVGVGQTDATFSAVFRSENLKLLPIDYEVQLASRGLAYFKHTPTGDDTLDVGYYIVAEQKK
jgi:hypothetical protein